MKLCRIVDLGTIPYAEASDLQRRLVSARKIGAIPDLLLFCEHPHVITLGRNGKRQHLHASDDLLSLKGVEFHQTNRGGDITYHGPGQIVGYPILNLDQIRRDVVWYVRQLETCMMLASTHFGIPAIRIPGRTGVWVESESRIGVNSPGGEHEKLASIGVHISRWVTSHGFAYNVSTDLSFFDLITPCGIAECRVTSLEKLLGTEVCISDVRTALREAFGEAFRLDLASASPSELNCWLRQTEAAALASA